MNSREGFDDDVTATLRGFEERLLVAGGQGRVEELAALIAPQFLEFGTSGRTYRKADVDEWFEKGAPNDAEIRDFSSTPLSADVHLATFVVFNRQKATESLRSSIWRRRDGRWELLFHQGTPKGAQP